MPFRFKAFSQAPAPDLQFADTDFAKCIDDIADGKKTSGPAKLLRKKIEDYMAHQLEPRENIGGNCFSTGFSHAVVTANADALLPPGWKRHSVTSFSRELCAANRDMLRRPDVALQCDRITLDHVLNNRAPSDGIRRSPDMPLSGIDAHGNQVTLFQASHPQMAGLAKELLKSHKDRLLPGDGANWSWARAAWMSALMQSTPDDLAIRLRPHCDRDDIERIQKLAQALKDGEQDAVTRTTTASAGGPDPDSFGLAYPDGKDCSADLKALTARLLAPVRDAQGQPASMKKDDIACAHVFSLLSALGARGVILGDAVPDRDGRTARQLAVSFPGTIHEATSLGDIDTGAHAQFMWRHSVGVPILVKNGTHFELRVPDPDYGRHQTPVEQPQSPAPAHSPAAAQPPAAAPAPQAARNRPDTGRPAGWNEYAGMAEAPFVRRDPLLSEIFAGLKPVDFPGRPVAQAARHRPDPDLPARRHKYLDLTEVPFVKRDPLLTKIFAGLTPADVDSLRTAPQSADRRG